MTIFWIVYVYSGDLTATKDALNTTGSYFGGIATLTAAYLASRLFNDWRDEYRLKLLTKYRMLLVGEISKLKDYNYNFSKYKDQFLTNTDTTHSKYLEYIWCYQDTQKHLKNYQTIISVLEDKQSTSNFLADASKLVCSMEENYQKTRMNHSDMGNVDDVFAKLNNNSGLVIKLEEFAEKVAFHYELLYLKKSNLNL